MLLLPIVCFPFSSSTSQSSTCFVVSSSFLQKSSVSRCRIFSFILVFTSLFHVDFFHFSAWSLFIPILSPISLALWYSVFVIPFFLCSKIIFCDILSLLLLIILWINIIVEYSILSFAGHMLVSISNAVEGVGTGSCSIFFNDWFCNIFLHASNPYNIAGRRHFSKSLIFTLISSCPTFRFDDNPSISLIILLALLSVFLCAVLDYLLCLALFLSNYM